MRERGVGAAAAGVRVWAGWGVGHCRQHHTCEHKQTATATTTTTTTAAAAATSTFIRTARRRRCFLSTALTMWQPTTRLVCTCTIIFIKVRSSRPLQPAERAAGARVRVRGSGGCQQWFRLGRVRQERRGQGAAGGRPGGYPGIPSAYPTKPRCDTHRQAHMIPLPECLSAAPMRAPPCVHPPPPPMRSKCFEGTGSAAVPPTSACSSWA